MEFSMNYHHSSPDPPRTLAERLAQLNDNLQSLGERLKASIAGLLGDTIADAVRDSVRVLLGSKEAPPTSYRDQRDYHSPDYYRDREDDPWGDEDRRWEEEEIYTPTRQTQTTRNESNRWRNALSAALQAALWFLKQQPKRRPVLTTVVVTFAAGITGFIAGPMLAAGTTVLASVAGLMLTADAYESAAELASG
jgi:hypothetical protein